MKEQLSEIHNESCGLHDRLNDLVRGKWIVVTSDWNGQPFGRSKASKKGHAYKVRGAELDVHWGIFLWLEGQNLSIRANEVEWR